MAVKDQTPSKPVAPNPSGTPDWPGRYLELSEEYGRETTKLRRIVTVLAGGLPVAAAVAFFVGRSRSAGK